MFNVKARTHVDMGLQTRLRPNWKDVWVDFRTQYTGHGLVTFSRWLVTSQEQASKEKSVRFLFGSFVLGAFFFFLIFIFISVC